MRRWYSLAAVAAVGALVVTWLIEPNLIIGLKSGRALAWLSALGAACLLVGWLAHRFGASPRVAIALGALPGLIATGVVVVRPIINPRELVEAFPTPATSRPAVVSESITPLPLATPSSTTASRPPPSQPTLPTPKPQPTAPERVSAGSLHGLAGHDARGTVTTYRLADGSHIVRFENVDIGGTPDPEVWVVPGRDQRGTSGGIHLGHLKAEKGSFNYALPPGFATAGYTVLVWCEQFAVEIANATQTT